MYNQEDDPSCRPLAGRGRHRGERNMHYHYWIFDMDGTLTDSMGIWDKVPFQLLAMYGRTPGPGLRERLLPLGMAETARLMIREYALPLDEAGFSVLALGDFSHRYYTSFVKIKNHYNRLHRCLQPKTEKNPGNSPWAMDKRQKL